MKNNELREKIARYNNAQSEDYANRIFYLEKENKQLKKILTEIAELATQILEGK